MLALVSLCGYGVVGQEFFNRSSEVAGLSRFLFSSSENSYYVDCQASSAGNGSAAAPWNSLVNINSRTFSPGDQILLKRGTLCLGELEPKGSGSEGSPIVLGAYGEGVRPVVKASGTQAAIRLFNQEYWTIEHLETKGGDQFGIYVGGDVANRTLHNIHISDVVVHDVNGLARWDSGLIVVAPSGQNLVFENVTIENAVVNNFENGIQGTAWWGIHVGFNLWYGDQALPSRSRQVTIRNSTVQNTYGDSITVAQTDNSLIEGNISRRSGLAPAGISYTPDAIWSWDSNNVTIQFNEGSESYSWGADGGIFDVDHGSTNTLIQYNYAHDAEGYCVAIFGAKNKVSSNTIFRYNVCAGNNKGGGPGDIILYTWEGGSLDGVQIYNNTIIRNPTGGAAAIWAESVSLSGTRPNFIKNNIIYSTSPRLIQMTAPISLERNLYWYAGKESPEWMYSDGLSVNSLSQHQSKSGQDAGSLYANPALPNPSYRGALAGVAGAFLPGVGSPAYNNGMSVHDAMGARDFAGTAIPQCNHPVK